MDNTKCTALQIAKYFVKKAKVEEDKKLTPLKLQKLLYYAQGWYLANFDKPLFDDKIQAWKYGPAVMNVYQYFKSYGSNSLSQYDNPMEEIPDIDDERTKRFLDKVWTVYKKYYASDLVSATHNEQPWVDTREDKKLSENSELIINIEKLKSYFKKRITHDK